VFVAMRVPVFAVIMVVHRPSSSPARRFLARLAPTLAWCRVCACARQG